MLIAGASILFVNNYLLSLSVQAQFVIILSFGLLAGLFMSYLYQSLEWALFFALGVQLVALTPILIQNFNGSPLQISELVGLSLSTAKYSLFLLSSWIIAIPTGFMLQKLIMGNYYRRTLF